MSIRLKSHRVVSNSLINSATDNDKMCKLLELIISVLSSFYLTFLQFNSCGDNFFVEYIAFHAKFRMPQNSMRQHLMNLYTFISAQKV